MGGTVRLFVDRELLEVHLNLRTGLGAEVIATAQADWLNAAPGAFLATLDFAAPNTATIPTTIDVCRIVVIVSLGSSEKPSLTL